MTFSFDSWVYVKPTDTVIQLLSDVRDYHNWIEIVIKQNRNNGIQCKVNFLELFGADRSERYIDIDILKRFMVSISSVAVNKLTWI